MRKLPKSNTNKRIETIGDEEILSALKAEASSFVPNRLGAIQKATGTYNPFKERDDLALTEILRNEGESVVPNIEKQVLTQVGAKKKFSFSKLIRKNGTLMAAFALIAVAAGSAIAVRIAVAGDVLTGSLITVSVQSASSLNRGTSSSIYGIKPSQGNMYSPSFTFFSDGSNIAKKSTLSCQNYSASIVSEEQKTAFEKMDDKEAPVFVSELLCPTYQCGYLETAPKESPNKIVINVYPTVSGYAEKYRESYVKAIGEALSDSSLGMNTWATIEINENTSFVSLRKELKDVSRSKAQDIAEIYYGFTVGGKSLVSVNDLKEEDESILSSLKDILQTMRNCPLSDKALESSISGLALSYNSYIQKGDRTDRETIEALKKKLSDKAGALPWSNVQFQDILKECLLDDSYYIMASEELEKFAAEYKDGMEITNEDIGLAYYFHIRDCILSGINKEEYSALLEKIKARSNKGYEHKDVPPFPDEGSRDGGNHGGPGGGEPHDPSIGKGGIA